MTQPDQIFYTFSNRARNTFFAIYNDFLSCAARLDRTRQELEFRNLQKQYAGRLQEQLTQLAQALLHEHRYEHDKEAGYRLNEMIREYQHEFLVHTRDL